MNKIKVCAVGDAAGGKTQLLRALIKHQFDPEYTPTITDEFETNHRNQPILLADTAGNEDYEKLRTTSYEKTNVFLIVFSIDHRRSFDRVKEWLADPLETPITIRSISGAPAILVGTKSDLRKSEAEKVAVTEKEAKEMAEEVGAFDYIETSAKDGINVQKLLDMIVDSVNRKDNKGKAAAVQVEQLPFEEGTLKVRAIKACNLRPADPNGLADPFVIVGLFGQTISHHFKALGKSKTIKKTLNPVWNEDIVVSLNARKLHGTEGISIQVWDEDLIGKDFLGSLHYKWDLVKTLGHRDDVVLLEDRDVDEKSVGVKGTLSFEVTFTPKTK